MIEYEAILKYSHLYIGESQWVWSLVGKFLDVSYGVIANVAQCAADEAEVHHIVWVWLKLLLDKAKGVAIMLCGGLAGFSVGYGDIAIFGA